MPSSFCQVSSDQQHIIALHAYGTIASYHNHKGWVVPDSARCNGVGHWLSNPILGESQQKTVSTWTDLVSPPPLYFMTSP